MLLSNSISFSQLRDSISFREVSRSESSLTVALSLMIDSDSSSGYSLEVSIKEDRLPGKGIDLCSVRPLCIVSDIFTELIGISSFLLGEV